MGICSACGSGGSQEALRKIAAQQRILGAPCPILECAFENHVEYCTRDCDSFPCDRFRAGPYPFSQGYLNMQERRRKERPQTKTPSGNAVEVPPQYWEDLELQDAASICQNSLAKDYPPHGLLLPFLKFNVLIDLQDNCLRLQVNDEWERIENPLLELLCLLYLINASPAPLRDELISSKELKNAHFFRGPHELRVQPLVERYGNDLDSFKKVADDLGGEILNMADASYRFFAFPKIPLHYLFWKGDQEFQPHLSILFDRSIEHHLAADAIWGVVTLVSDTLLAGTPVAPHLFQRFQ
jgi:hypothetical protein